MVSGIRTVRIYWNFKSSKPVDVIYLDGGEDEGVHAHCAGEPEVAEFDDAALAKQDVLWLHVAVEYTMRVEVVEGRYQLRGDWLDL